MSESRTLFLEQTLTQKGMHKAIEALDLMKKEMCAERDFKRHNGDHYYYHLVDVTQDLLNHNITHEPCIIASLLHDYMEDVEGVTYKLIEQKFGVEVADIVYLLTKQKHLNYKDPVVMMQYLHAISGNVWATLIKAADRKHNFSTLKDATFEKRLRQANETDSLFIPFFKAMRKRYPRYAAFFFGAKTAIEPHLWAIKEYQAEIERLNKELEETKFILEGLQK